MRDRRTAIRDVQSTVKLRYHPTMTLKSGKGRNKGQMLSPEEMMKARRNLKGTV